MAKEKIKEGIEDLNLELFIKKISIQLYLIKKELEKFPEETKKESSEITNKINKIDNELLKKFNIKFSKSTKEAALELISILK
ncbi:hypothetical protein [Flavobacterium psychrophilum]|uniref:hypothetical protein n=1 Tax=Flavobacterium psychrophilum TaxID=96345 RepID=UPI0010690CE4|nr:hypothetical protein [Flavobacterium psychrophilum]